MRMQKKKSSSSEELYGELGHAFNFTRGDLEANRVGFISHRQKQKQWKAVLGILCTSLAFMGLLLVILIGIYLAGLGESDLAQNGRMLWIVTFILCLVGYFSLHDLPSMFDDISAGRIETLVKHVKRKKQYIYKSGNRTILIVGEEEFLLPRELDDFKWKNNIAYRIYSLPNSKRILSIEEALPIED